MTHPDPNEETNSWDQLARELGIQNEGTNSLATGQPEPLPRKKEAETSQETDVFEPSPGRGRRAQPEQASSTEPTEIGQQAELTAEERQAGSAEEPSRSSRRRGQDRSQRADTGESRVAEAGRTEPADAAPEAEMGMAGDRQRRRGRGRGRRKKDLAELEEATEDRAEGQRPVDGHQRDPDDADTEDMDTLSDWNVPSWAELIASLYRPDR
jgi:hypothetical protein